MLVVARRGASAKVLETRDLNALGTTAGAVVRAR